MQARLFGFLFSILSTACLVQGDSPGDDRARGVLGKADRLGTCQDDGEPLCGGPGIGNCWCDEACVDYGDCCDDVDVVCGIELPEPETRLCGGLSDLGCDDDELCLYTPEQMCGATDDLGVCTMRPEVCTQDFAPVCGCDATTYPNACLAVAAGTSVAHEGPCEPSDGRPPHGQVP